MEGLKPGSSNRTDSFAGRTEAAGRPRLEQLGEYRILREIGHGGMGSVTREETKSALGTDSRVARFGPTTPKHFRAWAP
jgi:hypothetical protein